MQQPLGEALVDLGALGGEAQGTQEGAVLEHVFQVGCRHGRLDATHHLDRKEDTREGKGAEDGKRLTRRDSFFKCGKPWWEVMKKSGKCEYARKRSLPCP